MSSPFLGATLGLPGAVVARWYQLVGPGDFAIVEVCFLNGVMTPTIETGQIDFARLGLALCAYFDFGTTLFESAAG